MSIIAALNAASANVAASASAPLIVPERIKSFDLSGALSRAYPAILASADGGNISGRHLKMGPSTYASAVGKVSADSVANALIYAVIHFQNGSQSLDALADAKDGKGKPTLPSWLSALIRGQYSDIKPNRGVDEARLRTEAGALADKITAGAAPVKSNKASPAPTAVPTAAPTEAPTAAPTVKRIPSDLAMLTGAMPDEALSGAMDRGAVRAHWMEQGRAHAAHADLSMGNAHAVPAPMVPVVANDYPAAASAFVAQHGADKARLFLEALSAALQPTEAPAPAPVPAVKRVRKAKAA